MKNVIDSVIKGEITITDMVRKPNKVKFNYYKDKEFWYIHDNGFLFPIPLSDVDDISSKPTLLAEDNAMFFMRWIRKYIIQLKTTNNL